MTTSILAQAQVALEGLGSVITQAKLDSFMAQCPVHPDRSPSLSVWVDDEGKLGLNCLAGCDNSEVRSTVISEMRGGKVVSIGSGKRAPYNADREEEKVKRPVGRLRPSEIAAREEAKALKDSIILVEVCRYAYEDLDGELLWEKIRYNRVAQGGVVVGKEFRQQLADGSWSVAPLIKELAASNDGVPLYNLREAYESADLGMEIIVAEGEKDVETAREHGLVAVSTAGGGKDSVRSYSWWALRGSSMVTIVADRDAKGYQRAAEALKELIHYGIDAVVKRTPLDQARADLTDHFEAGLGMEDLEIVPAELLGGKPAPDHKLVDLAAFITGTYEVEKPSLFSRSDGAWLFYPGAMHSVYGQPESGKSLLVQFACAQQIQEGKHVLYVDYEDSPASIVSRMINLLGCTPAQVGKFFHYLNPGQDATVAEESEAWEETLHAFPYALAVLDGVIPAMQQAGLDENSNADTSKWFDRMPKAIVKASGAAVVMIDHVAKTSDGASRFAIGAQYKLGAIDGASYFVDVVKPMGKGMAGEIKMLVTKDRRGEVRGISEAGNGRLQEAARFKLDSSDPANVMIALDPPQAAPSDEELGYAMAIGVRNLLERMDKDSVPASESAVWARAKEEGKKWTRAATLGALKSLVESGYVTLEQGARGAKIHRLVEGAGFYPGKSLKQPGSEDGLPPEKFRVHGGGSLGFGSAHETWQAEEEANLMPGEITISEWAEAALAGVDDAPMEPAAVKTRKRPSRSGSVALGPEDPEYWDLIAEDEEAAA